MPAPQHPSLQHASTPSSLHADTHALCAPPSQLSATTQSSTDPQPGNLTTLNATSPDSLALAATAINLLNADTTTHPNMGSAPWTLASLDQIASYPVIAGGTNYYLFLKLKDVTGWGVQAQVVLFSSSSSSPSFSLVSVLGLAIL